MKRHTHKYEAIANVHGDYINSLNGKRTLVYCPSCGKIKFIKEYIKSSSGISYGQLAQICNYNKGTTLIEAYYLIKEGKVKRWGQ